MFGNWSEALNEVITYGEVLRTYNSCVSQRYCSYCASFAACRLCSSGVLECIHVFKPVSRSISFIKVAHLLKIIYRNEYFAGPRCCGMYKYLLGKFQCDEVKDLKNIFVQHAKLLLINGCEQQLISSMKSVVFYLISAHEIINTFNVLLFYPYLDISIIADMMHVELWK